ncbi:hypothetical protein BJX68DRAFT_233353 [Aspergillus pseudodeflectus]|uniref:Uncharacterized protein n=1 Tax=Aspergillus pseudodeflectus TaxID=176178 RepID=A0ABR4KPD5_9EURO
MVGGEIQWVWCLVWFRCAFSPAVSSLSLFPDRSVYLFLGLYQYMLIIICALDAWFGLC